KNIYFNQIHLSDYDAIVVSDYQKGIVDEYIIEKLEKFNGPIFVDTKKEDLYLWSNRAKTFVKINSKEYKKSKNADKLEYLIVTEGSAGATLFLCGNMDKSFPLIDKLDSPNVIGCGDTFFAGFIINFMKTNDLYEAIEYANKVASKSAEKFGTVSVKKEEVVQ
ncbi:MAG: PfkB family carbohydrate kinase, partial [Nanoarchaeota archaeon]